MRHQKRKKGKGNENGSKKQKQKPDSATQEPEDLLSQPGNLGQSKSHDERESDLGDSLGDSLKASHCSELGFI